MKEIELIPVIHAINFSQVGANINTCVKCGIKKVFLINHAISKEDLLVYARRCKSFWPDLWVGVNILGISTEQALGEDLEPLDALWCDATISVESALKCRTFKGMFFGGLAFKYQPQPTDIEQACSEAILATDVATTSGSATGKAASIEKIEMLREHLGNHPMAIASGVSINNIDLYKGKVDYLLVASSITSFEEIIIEEKLKQLKNKLDEE